MALRIKGADLIAWWKEWPPGEDYYVEDFPFVGGEQGGVYEEVDCAPASPVDPAKTYTIDGGILIWQGKGDPPGDVHSYDVEPAIRRWLKARTSRTFAVEVGLSDVEAFRAVCAERGWKVS